MEKKMSVSLDNGNEYYSVDDLTHEQIDNNWDQLVMIMDPDIREQVHLELAPCSNRDFLRRYLEIATDNLIIG
jgi:hypothetical protein